MSEVAEAKPKNGFRQEPFKKTVNERLREQMNTRDEAIRVALQNAQAAMRNEEITRRRFEAFLGMSFKERAVWAATGALPESVLAPVAHAIEHDGISHV